MEEKKDFSYWISKANNNIGIVSAMFLGSLGIFYAAWEFSDRWQERTIQQTEYERERDNEQQAFFINQAINKGFDSLREEIAESNSFFYTNSIKKDSLILIVFPVLSKELSKQRLELNKINQKLGIIIDKSKPSDKFDFMKVLNERDSLRFNQAVTDSINEYIMQDIMRRTDKLKSEYNRPKFGDRVK